MDFFDIKTMVTTIITKSRTAKNQATNNHSTKGNSVRGNSTKNWCLTLILTSIFTLILTVFTGPAFSATAKKRDIKEDRWFEVELIVFAHLNREALESEKWPEITDLVLPEKMVELSQPAPESPEKSKPKVEEKSLVFMPVTPGDNSTVDTVAQEPIPMPKAFVMLRDEELQLKDSFKKLRGSKNFKPLLHVAWRQPTYDKKRAQTVLLYEGMTEPEFVMNKNTKSDNKDKKTKATRANKSNKSNEKKDIEAINPRFAGTVQVSVARYLHFAADLVYRTPVTQQIATTVHESQLWEERPYPTLFDPQGPAYQIESWKAMRGFRLKESRRMRSKRIHYLDHPFLGVVVLITPVELPKDPEELSATDS